MSSSDLTQCLHNTYNGAAHSLSDVVYYIPENIDIDTTICIHRSQEDRGRAKSCRPSVHVYYLLMQNSLTRSGCFTCDGNHDLSEDKQMLCSTVQASQLSCPSLTHVILNKTRMQKSLQAENMLELQMHIQYMRR